MSIISYLNILSFQLETKIREVPSFHCAFLQASNGLDGLNSLNTKSGGGATVGWRKSCKRKDFFFRFLTVVD